MVQRNNGALFKVFLFVPIKRPSASLIHGVPVWRFLRLTLRRCCLQSVAKLSRSVSSVAPSLFPALV